MTATVPEQAYLPRHLSGALVAAQLCAIRRRARHRGHRRSQGCQRSHPASRLSRKPHGAASQSERYRDRDKTEVAIVIESRQKIWGVEIKAAASVNRDDAKGLLKLAGIAGNAFQAGIVFYDGEATLPLVREAGILAVPISKLWEL